ncbi:MAG: hypothetical protein GEV10_18820 [Streptosporangiales bacterium]|nr:hypothetical protein [Streptosporangiales bacterium]
MRRPRRMPAADDCSTVLMGMDYLVSDPPTEGVAAMRLLATGDAILTRRLAHRGDDSPFEPIRDALRGADIAFTNFEAALPDLPATPGPVRHGMHLMGHPDTIEDLRWLGIDVVNIGNNHALDYSTRGLDDLIARLSAARLPFAGAGRTLGEAREPVFVDSPAGRFALVGVCASTADVSLATDPNLRTTGRSGVNPLRWSTTYSVTEDDIRYLADLDERLGTAAARVDRVAASKSRIFMTGGPNVRAGSTVPFAGTVFTVGDETRVNTRAHPHDLDDIDRSVDFARRSADVVAVSVHCHEGAADGWNSYDLPDFLVEASHRWIDAGADVVIGHGPHCIRGVEVYQGKPILYSTGNFFFTPETVPYLPEAAYLLQGVDAATSTPRDYFDAVEVGFSAHRRFWEAIMVSLDVGGGSASLEIRPLVLSSGELVYRRGEPALATGAEGEAILDTLDELSKPFGTAFTRGQRAGAPVATLPLG